MSMLLRTMVGRFLSPVKWCTTDEVDSNPLACGTVSVLPDILKKCSAFIIKGWKYVKFTPEQATKAQMGCRGTALFWCDFDCASSIICGNKMPTRCNRGFYCRSYCLLNMFRAPLCWGLCVRFAGCCSILQTGAHNPQLHTRPATWKPQHEIPQAATTV